MKPILLAGAALLSAFTPSAFARPLTPLDMVMMRRLSEPAVSPDGRQAAYQLRETDLDANKGRNDIWLADLAKRGAEPVRFASLPDKNETAPAFAPDGRALYFLSDRSGSDQVWMTPLAGGPAVQVTWLERDVAGFRLSPQGDRIALWFDERADCVAVTCKDAEPQGGSGRTYDKLFVRHWDRWADGKRARLASFALKDGVVAGEGAVVSRGLDGDVPSKPHGGGEEIAWSPDGKTLYFALREAGRTEAWSTNLDIFEAPADGSAAAVNLTKGREGTDNQPAVSPDGKWLAWLGMERATYEADRNVVYLRDLASGATRALTQGWDRSVDSIAWSADGRHLLATARDHFDKPLFEIDAVSGKVRRLTGEGSVGSAVPLKGGAVYTLDSLTSPTDLYRLDARGKASRLTAVNADKLADIDMPAATRFSFKGANGDMVWGYALRPAGMAKDAKAPVAYLIHGGPQSTLGNGWSYRWNPAVWAGAGYGAVLVDFHGSVGYGQAFTDAINQDWGGKPLEDLKRGLDAAARQFPWLDARNGCALGGSYGGYMVNWIAGQWADGFKCLVSHAGVFDVRAMAFETEELWFDEWEHGGPYWEKAEVYERWNPVLHVTKWKTPMLVIHGEKDFRIPYTQGLAAFTALQRQDIPSRLLVFADENHWILKPKNSLQWYGEVIGWMDRWTQKKAP